MKPYDYIVIGSGVAGLSVALHAAADNQKVLVITKSHLEESNTRWAQGGIAAAVSPDDSPISHKQDTLIAGAGLCDEKAVEVLTNDAPDRIAELLRLGVAFDREANGELELGREGAHSANRILHAGGDATGSYIEKGLANAVRHLSNITLLEESFVTELLVENGRVVGATYITAQGETQKVRGRFTVIASGGIGQLFRYTTNPEITTGDGIALAWRAGAALADLEFFQFHPTALNLPGAPSFLISEAVRGDGAILRNSKGRAFMKDYDSRGELASRDIVSRAIAREMQKTNGLVYLDATHLGADTIKHRFPSIYKFCLQYKIDMTDQPLPVSPAAHYFMGGIATGLNGETSLPGLFACGEAACTGVHGANRLASNSLLEGLVFGRRVYEYSKQDEVKYFDPTTAVHSETLLPPLLIEKPQISATDNKNATVPTLADVQNLAWQQIGLSRDAENLRPAVATFNEWQQALAVAVAQAEPNRKQQELYNLVTVGALMAEAALRREESRGAHYRTDFPTASDEWRRRIVFKKLIASS